MYKLLHKVLNIIRHHKNELTLHILFLFILRCFIAISLYNYSKMRRYEERTYYIMLYIFNNYECFLHRCQVFDVYVSLTKRKRIVICRHIAASSHDASSDAALHVSHGGGSRRWSSPGFRTAGATADPPSLTFTLAFASHDESSGSPASRDDERDGESDIHCVFVLGTTVVSSPCVQNQGCCALFDQPLNCEKSGWYCHFSGIARNRCVNLFFFFCPKIAIFPRFQAYLNITRAKQIIILLLLVKFLLISIQWYIPMN